MLEPVERNLSCRIGADYFDDWHFWQDDAQTVHYDFTGWSQFTLLVSGLTLVEGAGLTVDHAGGIISPSIGRTITATMKPGTASYALSVIDSNNRLGFLMIGVFEWLEP